MFVIDIRWYLVKISFITSYGELDLNDSGHRGTGPLYLGDLRRLATYPTYPQNLCVFKNICYGLQINNSAEN